MKTARVSALISALILFVAMMLTPASAHVSEQLASLSAKKVEPEPGPDGGRGNVKIRSASEIETVCYQLRFREIGKGTAAHIHEGEAGDVGEVVVTLFDSQQERSSPQDGCVSPVSAGLIEAMQTHPQSYYVDVHTSEFPDGAIRGQMRNAAGSYSPPANCGRFRPVRPDSPSTEKAEALKAKVRRVTDGATKTHSVKLAHIFGPSLWESATRTPIAEDTAFFNLQVDTASLHRQLFIRAEWPAPSPSEIDLVLYDGFGKQVAISDANNLLPATLPLPGSIGTGGPGYEELSGYEAADCSGYTLEVRALRTLGEQVKLSAWLEDE